MWPLLFNALTHFVLLQGLLFSGTKPFITSSLPFLLGFNNINGSGFSMGKYFIFWTSLFPFKPQGLSFGMQFLPKLRRSWSIGSPNLSPLWVNSRFSLRCWSPPMFITPPIGLLQRPPTSSSSVFYVTSCGRHTLLTGAFIESPGIFFAF